MVSIMSLTLTLRSIVRYTHGVSDWTCGGSRHLGVRAIETQPPLTMTSRMVDAMLIDYDGNVAELALRPPTLSAG